MVLSAWRLVISVLFRLAMFAGVEPASIAGPDDVPPAGVPKLDQAQREAIVAAANQALMKHVRAERKKGAPDDIDANFWGDAISKLKPIRVRNDHINVAIVLSQKD